MDAVETANNYGIDADKAVTYMADAIGTSTAWDALSSVTAGFVRMGKKAMANSWKSEIEEDTKKRSRR